jgi:hypothetical protein
MVSTLKEHEAVLRNKCRNGTLYRNDAKLASWLGVAEFEVSAVLNELLDADVLRRSGTSSRGSEVYCLAFPSWLSDDARRLYGVMVSAATAADVVNVSNNAELAALAGMTTGVTVYAWSELSRAGLVAEETFNNRRFPVIVRRFPERVGALSIVGGQVDE